MSCSPLRVANLFVPVGPIDSSARRAPRRTSRRSVEKSFSNAPSQATHESTLASYLIRDRKARAIIGHPPFSKRPVNVANSILADSCFSRYSLGRNSQEDCEVSFITLPTRNESRRHNGYNARTRRFVVSSWFMFCFLSRRKDFAVRLVELPLTVAQAEVAAIMMAFGTGLFMRIA